MGKTDRILTWVFAGVMLVFCFFMVFYLTTRAELDFQLADVELSLETSRGRERKQQFEYDEVTEELPRTRAELSEVQPAADAAAEKVAELKAERKALRKEKADLEEAMKSAGEGPHE